jgi:hypothetical protein
MFEEMNALTRKYNDVNLGSGTPSDPVPQPIQAAAAKAIA